MKLLDFFEKSNVAINATNERERNTDCSQIFTERPSFTPDYIIFLLNVL